MTAPRFNPLSIPRRFLGAAVVVALACLAISCATRPGAETQPAAARVLTPRVTAKVDVPVPPGVDPALLAPRSGESLARAKMELPAILASIPQPAYIVPATQPGDRPTAAVGEPPPEAQRRYVRGRQAWLEMRGADAINELRATDALYPNSPDVLQLLGQIYTLSGNRVRGGYYFEQAVRLNPEDAESLFFLGRFAIDQEHWSQAIATFARARSLQARHPEIDPAIWALIDISLAGALDREGYDSAAVQQYAAYLNHPVTLGRTTRMVRELAVLARQRGLIWQAVGDGLNRLSDPESALEAYAMASEEGETDPAGLSARLVYSHLRLGHADAARQTMLARLETEGVTPPMLEQVRYLAEHGGGSASLIAALRPWYESKSRPVTLALTLGDLLGDAPGRAFWLDHLAAKPGDYAVFEQLAARVFTVHPPVPEAVTDVVRGALIIIKATPDSAQRVSATLTEAAGDQAALIAGLQSLIPGSGQGAALEFLLARCLLKVGRFDDGMTALRRSIEADAGFAAPRVGMASIQIEEGDLDGAGKTLAPLSDRTEPRVIILRARLLQQTGHVPEAMQLINTAIARQPLNAELLIEKAGLQQASGDLITAEQTLLGALDSGPQSEAVYEALFRLYSIPGVRPDVQEQVDRLMRRLVTNLPQSRLARLARAESLLGGRQFDQAERVLRQMLVDYPGDAGVLRDMLSLLDATNRRPEAEAMLQKRVEATPKDTQTLVVAAWYYRDVVRNREKTEEYFLRIFELQPPSPERAINMAKLRIRRKEYDLADRDLTAAIEKFPEQDAELGYYRSLIAQHRGDQAASEKIMEDLLRRHPDHPNTNNGLGYVWANRGVNLDRAFKMIKLALDAEPNSAAILDSMGWVNYKLGRFGEAVLLLRRAATADQDEYPVILDHLGDALYRDGKTEEAAAKWHRAQERLTGQQDESDDFDLVGLGDRLKAKLDALSRKQPVPVAALGEGVTVPPPAKPAQDVPNTPEIVPENTPGIGPDLVPQQAPVPQPAPAPAR
ncbi:MAG: tetratricopeptide repeat protein [Planctomycetes bacterium]|nr:tetratricopeptide repeat protein [Planctomycetota bacterium]